MVRMPTRQVNIVLKVVSVVFIAFIILIFASIFLFTNAKLNNLSRHSALLGTLDLSQNGRYEATPTALSGEWEYYPGLALPQGQPTLAALPDAEQTIRFPISSIMDATGPSVYRLRLRGIHKQDGMMLYIPTLNNPISIYVNGTLCEPLEPGATWLKFSVFQTIYAVHSFDASLEEQEIVIVANFRQEDTALYKRPVILGSLSDIISHSDLNIMYEILAFGAILLIMITAFIFMFFLPDHRLMTLITVFDTLLMLRIIFGLSAVTGFFRKIFPSFSDSTFFSLQIFFLMLSGAMGVILAHYLFDPHNKVPPTLCTIPACTFLVLAVLLPMRLDLYDQYKVVIIAITYLLTFSLVLLQIIVYWKHERTCYSAFQIVKTVYIAFIIYFDFISFNQGVSFLPYTCLYMLFFLAHITIRQYDNNLNFRSALNLNQTLESTVAERTRELANANRILSELSIRDPLTNTFNRLYLEQVLDKRIPAAEAEHSTFHCCMFDLDHFKDINDHYGHDIGDEQLIAAVRTVTELISPDCILTRVGGEEFVILYFGFTDEEAQNNVNHIRETLEEQAKIQSARTTASFGLVKFHAGMTRKSLLKQADLCLYTAKNSGRNRVECDFSPPQSP